MVSRFRKPAETKQILKDFAEGKIEVLVGTHRVLSRDVIPKDLGLVILDEEQRFGVAQKELLRRLRLEVDVLALSATPIPRTLHMSLSGLRDISIIETPPEGRRPIRTTVGEYDEELVRTALERELERGGQAFYLHNRVETIEEAAEKLQQLCPKLRFIVAHGQMRERELEEKMHAFLRGDADVLVSTTIIESGIDIPQANTLIVERADVLGLSPALPDPRPRRPLRRDRARLPALPRRDGALARGAGAALDARRPHRARRRLPDRDARPRDPRRRRPARRRAVRPRRRARLRALRRDARRGRRRAAGPARAWQRGRCGSTRASTRTCRRRYVASEALKIDIHRRLALAESDDELRELHAALEDRYGPVPEPVEHLFAIQEAKLKLARLGADYLVYRGGRATVGPARARLGGAARAARRRPTRPSTRQRNVKFRCVTEELEGAIELVDAIVVARQAA